jgi:hypothetical protein
MLEAYLVQKLYLDTETVGLHSMPVLIQYAIEEGPITLYDVWKEPIYKTLRLIESWLDYCIVGFNLAFDVFQLVKLYTIFRLCPRDWIPEAHINEIAAKEMYGRDGPAIKFASALDLMLHSRKGEYQALMARSDVRIRKVPTALAYALAEELEKRVEIDGIYFARKADPEAARWSVFDREVDGEFDENFKDVVLRFSPAGGLKFLAEHAMGYEPKYHYSDVEPPKDWYPMELGYAPFANAISSAEKNWEVWSTDKKGEPKLMGKAWPACIQKFIDWWAYNEPAREYANDDIVYTRALDGHFKFPPIGDDDSILSTMVPVVRWRGFKIDKEGMVGLREKAQAKVDDSPINTNTPTAVRAYMEEVLDDIEVLAIESKEVNKTNGGWSTKKANLVSIREMMVEEDEECAKCEGKGCVRCDDGMLKASVKPCGEDMGNHPAAYRAKEILDIKIAAKEVELYNKLILAGRFHASFVVVGTKSSRMAGTDGLNAQGIKATKEVRRCFPLAWEGYTLCGGDFDSFEVTLADAVYNDPTLRDALIQKIDCPFCNKTKVCHHCKGKGCKNCRKSGKCGECDDNCEVRQKIHGLFGMAIFPGHTYAQVLASSGAENDMYTKGKQGVFAMLYGGTWETLVRNLGVKEHIAKEAMDNFDKSYPGVAKARERTFDAFCSMRQPGGVGSQVVWKEPNDYVETFLGFKRYFTLENRICRAMFEFAQAPPKGWRNHPVKVWRRDRVQTAGGAVASALYGAAFGLQQSNMRAAANHEIQSPGGQITKHVQRAIWDLQPYGVHELYVSPLNVHDEIMCVTHPDYVKKVTAAVRPVVESYRPQVPLIGMTWNESQANWAEKKGGSITVKMCAPEME